MPEECGNLAPTWLDASEDPIVGIDQTSQWFFNGIYDNFTNLSSAGASNKQYGGRGHRATRAKWDAISSDCQKFRQALRFIRACKPTGVTEDQILSMAIANHFA